MTESERAEFAGLTDAEAAQRLADDGPNELPTAGPRTIWTQLIDVIKEPMLLLLLGAGTVNFLLSEPLDGIVLGAFVLVVIGIEVYQEHKTERALESLRDLSSPRALVIRDGRRLRIAGREVVRGDVILLAEGDRVPADSVLVSCVNVSVDESALTGESVPVRKGECGGDASASPQLRPGGDGTPWVFSGTLVVSGQGIAVVRETGGATELGRIGAALKAIEPQRTPLQREVDKLVGTVAVLGVGLAVFVVVAYGLMRGGWLQGLLAGIATAMAMLPEEFPVVLTVFLALGAWRLSQKHVLTRRSMVIETLGSATVICVDKTGTLTQNKMTVRELLVGGDAFMLDGAQLPEEFHEITEFAVLASPIDPFDPMDIAFRDLGHRYLAETEHLHSDWDLVREYPLSEHLLALSHVWRSPDGVAYVIAAKGAPEAIADLCHFDAERLERLTGEVEAATQSGQRVLGVAKSHFSVNDGLPREQHDFDFEFVGLIGLHDPVRPGVADAVDECRRAGIRTVMITGDFPGTALAIAREVGIEASNGAMTGPRLAEISDEDLAAHIREITVFARMVPEQKLRIVRALKANGEIVAMTGDGVNDAPALKAADIGIAMGERGTDVAREAAALVITDDDFTSIVGGVRAGRGIFDNLRKAMAYIIAVHVPIAGMSLIPVVIPGWPLVLMPLQIAFLELVIDPACSVAFEAEPHSPELMDVPPRSPGAPLFGRQMLTISALQGLSVLVLVFSVYAWAHLGGRSTADVRALTFGTLVVGNLALILTNRSWTLSAAQAIRQRPNPTVWWVVGIAIVALMAVLYVPVLRQVLGFGLVHPLDLAVILAAGVVGVSWFEIYKWFRRRSVGKTSVSDR